MISIVKLRLLRLKDEYLVFIIMTAMALGLTFIFGFSFGGYRPSVIIVDEDKSSYSEAFIEELETIETYNFIAGDLNSAPKQVEEGKAIVALVINEGFQEDIQEGRDITLGQIKVKDDTYILSLQESVRSLIVKTAGSRKVAQVTGDFISSQKPVSKEEIEEGAYQSVMEAWKFKNPLRVTSTVADTDSKTGYDAMKHSMIGFTIFFSMYTMVFSIGTILSDKQYKTWERMLISPVSRSSILGGTMFVSFLVGMVQMIVLIVGGKYLIGIDWGQSMGGILMVTSAFVFTVTSMGLMLSGIVKTQAQLGAVTPVVLTSTSMLGGCMWPLEIVNNKVLLFLAELTPQKWAIQGMENIAAKGMGFEAAIMPSLVILAMGLVFFGLGIKTVE